MKCKIKVGDIEMEWEDANVDTRFIETYEKDVLNHIKFLVKLNNKMIVRRIR